VGALFLGVPCLGNDGAWEALFRSGLRTAFVAVGENARRGAAATEMRALGYDLANAIHPSAIVSASAQLGTGIAIMPGAIVNAATTIADDVILNTAATVDHDCRIGAGTHIAPGCHLAGYVTVGAGVLIGVGSIVGRGRPISIGAGAKVGIGSVVFRDVPPGTMAVGNPARILRETAEETQAP
jgi:UDP-perosamine 4-acetyltransferase